MWSCVIDVQEVNRLNTNENQNLVQVPRLLEVVQRNFGAKQDVDSDYEEPSDAKYRFVDKRLL